MSREQVKSMVLAILKRSDYDLWKWYDPELSEDWDAAEEQLEQLIEIAVDHMEHNNPNS